jgi:ABC-2 type transport system permease protein
MFPAPLRTDRASAGLNLSAMGPLFGLALRQLCRGRRLFLLAFLFAIPALLALILRLYNPSGSRDDLAFGLIFWLAPHALLPLVALVFASGMIQDEIEEQTLTYLLVRPLKRWAIYLVKLLAAIIVCVGLTWFFVGLAYLVIYAGDPNVNDILARRFPRTAAIMTLGLVTYCSLFGFLSLLTRRSLIAGMIYIGVFELLLANIPFMVRSLTVMYYMRTLFIQSLPISEAHRRGWRMELADVPGTWTCVWVLLIASTVLTAAAAALFTTKEFRLKTPGGS